ncbi:MAG TPA: enoyl-CoA hydratase/isomerase family protein [Pseudomonadales bacterium]
MEAELVHHGSWAELVMNRPERKNAITGTLGRAMAACLDQVQNDQDIQALVLRGAGGAFCSGLDLKEFNAQPAPDWLPEFQSIWRSVHRGLFRCRVPIVGALERYAINGGAALALACDLLIVGEAAFLQVGEVQIGMAAPYNLAWLALRHPEAIGARLALIGDRHDGKALTALGVATQCTADDAVLETAHALASRLGTFPDGAAARIKHGIRSRLDQDADAWFDRFTSGQRASAPPPAGRL